MVLVSFALVVLATITLVIGLLQSGLTLIYVSIGCSVLAGLVLAVAVLRGRPEEAPATPGRPTVPAGAGPATPPPAPAGARPWESQAPSAGEPTVPSWGPPPSAPTPEPEPAPEREPAPALAGVLASRLGRDRTRADDEDRTEQVDVMALDEEEDDEGFPIENYDRLRASEILRKLPDLSPEELERVREREVAGMNRFTVLSRIDAQLETAEPAGDWDIDEAAGGAAAAARKAPARKVPARKAATTKKAAAKKAPMTAAEAVAQARATLAKKSAKKAPRPRKT